MKAGRRIRLPAMAAAACLLACAACSSREESAPLLSPDEFVLLYARLVHQREAASDSTLAAPVDTLDAEQIRRLQEFVERAPLEPEDWSRLQERVRDHLQTLTRSESDRDASDPADDRRRAR